jgi:hypothetical protein
MKDDGQMILLSALIACLCLIGVVACITAVDDGYRSRTGYLSSDSIENIQWARDSALKDAAAYNTNDAWEKRATMALGFENDVNASMESLSYALLKHGVACRFSYNDSLAGEYVTANPGNDTENLGGILVDRNQGRARLYGCAYDMFADDGSTSYRLSRVAIFD